MRNLIIVRTHRADAASLAAYDRYAALPGTDVVFCVDERAGEADMGGRAKIGFNQGTWMRWACTHIRSTDGDVATTATTWCALRAPRMMRIGSLNPMC